MENNYLPNGQTVFKDTAKGTLAPTGKDKGKYVEYISDGGIRVLIEKQKKSN